MLPYVTYKWMYLGSHKLQNLPVGGGSCILFCLQDPVEDLDIRVQHDLLHVWSWRQVLRWRHIGVNFHLEGHLQCLQVGIVLLFLQVFKTRQTPEVVINTDQLQVRQMTIGNSRQEVRDVLPVQGLVSKFLQIPSNSLKFLSDSLKFLKTL